MTPNKLKTHVKVLAGISIFHVILAVTLILIFA